MLSSTSNRQIRGEKLINVIKIQKKISVQTKFHNFSVDVKTWTIQQLEHCRRPLQYLIDADYINTNHLLDFVDFWWFFSLVFSLPSLTDFLVSAYVMFTTLSSIFLTPFKAFSASSLVEVTKNQFWHEIFVFCPQTQQVDKIIDHKILFYRVTSHS